MLFIVYLQVNTLTWQYSCGIYGVWSTHERGCMGVLFMVYLQVNTLTWLYRCVVYGVRAGQHTNVAV